MRWLALLAALALSGCGFRPLYASGLDGELGGPLGDVSIGDVRGPQDARDLMRSTLSKRLPPQDGDERYQMAIDLREQRRAVSVNIDSNARRFNYTLTGKVTYTDKETGERRVQNLQSVASFAVTPSQYASLVAREDAVRRAVLDLARKIELDAAFYAQDVAPTTSNETLFPESNTLDAVRQLENEARIESEREGAEAP
ncbi:LPS assembly lipoprotein LptE [Parvularcula lutaonensis]|uniref:LPS assembly lipoprotein LptE n=1 Tax=Parvularcula lutaonensis TaxID=491923 RepID=A0ABV7M999_9PROT|nr:LPS assembly lipoprotein LptE [Parvularcula lutaonensis]GGY45956.1 hypothetical protein GCM10007148_13780 [Parvularcula lutaonensis]